MASVVQEPGSAAAFAANTAAAATAAAGLLRTEQERVEALQVELERRRTQHEAKVAELCQRHRRAQRRALRHLVERLSPPQLAALDNAASAGGKARDERGGRSGRASSRASSLPGGSAAALAPCAASVAAAACACGAKGEQAKGEAAKGEAATATGTATRSACIPELVAPGGDQPPLHGRDAAATAAALVAAAAASMPATCLPAP